MQKIISVPKGPALEYSPLAFNAYKSCSHGCIYCYCPAIFRNKSRVEFHNEIDQKEKPIERLKDEVSKWKHKKQQVLLSFVGDPYAPEDCKNRYTRKALEILLSNGFPVSILSKGGKRILKDLDIFIKYKNKIKVGATLTMITGGDSKHFEPKAAVPRDRMETLKELHKNGIRTWVSLEPVLDTQATLNLIQKTHSYVDEYKIGRWNHSKDASENIDWRKFLYDAVKLLRKYKCNFYVKNDLARYSNSASFFKGNERNARYWDIR
jgi:DNA repair photolyase